jgi:hypothetical protein
VFATGTPTLYLDARVPRKDVYAKEKRKPKVSKRFSVGRPIVSDRPTVKKKTFREHSARRN